MKYLYLLLITVLLMTGCGIVAEFRNAQDLTTEMKDWCSEMGGVWKEHTFFENDKCVLQMKLK